VRKRWIVGLSLSGLCAAGFSFFLFGAQSNATAGASLTLQPDGHYTTPVMIDGEGPFPFIVDTGAQRSVISRDLADRLSLTRMLGATVNATSGNGPGGITFLKTYSSALFHRTGAMMVVLPAGGIVKDGVMGMELFGSRRLEMNFADGTVSNAASQPTPRGFRAVPVSIVQGTFLVADVTVDGVQAKAMIDTGARRTLGNSLLRKALGLADGDARLADAQPVGGATIHKTQAMKAPLGVLILGEHRFEHPIVTFSDISVLQALDLSDQPALVVGLDLLRTLKAVAIDYPRSELQVKP
jgi:predicted aspartyl protease